MALKDGASIFLRDCTVLLLHMDVAFLHGYTFYRLDIGFYMNEELYCTVCHQLPTPLVSSGGSPGLGGT